MKNKRQNPYPMLTEDEQIKMPLEALLALDECLIYADLLQYGRKRFDQLLNKCERNPFKLKKYLKNIINAKLHEEETQAINEARDVLSERKDIVPGEKPQAPKPFS